MTNFKIDLQANKSSADGTIMAKVNAFSDHFNQHEQLGYNFYRKPASLTMCDRKVDIEDRFNGGTRSMLMFGSNSYLGASAYEEAINKSISMSFS